MMKTKIAYFISPHGFGPAARSAAIMESMNEINDNIEYHIFTLVPDWFFVNSNIHNFNYHELMTDIGVVQKTPLKEDIDRTIKELNEYYPLQNNLVDEISKELHKLQINLVISDISPLGLVPAEKAGISSVLVDNFTWDWIYHNYNLNNEQLNNHILYLNNIYVNADYRIRTSPVCYPFKNDLITNPVSRKPRLNRKKVREILNISESDSMVVITMGGITSRYNYINKLYKFDNISFIITGIAEKFTTINNLILLPNDSYLYHPDLISASDAVVGKLGYGTLAEVYNSGVPFGYITRDNFPESSPLEKYAESNMKGLKISSGEFDNNLWINRIEELVSMERVVRREINGADQAASFINKIIV